MQIEALTPAPKPGDPLLQLPSFMTLNRQPLLRGDPGLGHHTRVHDPEPTLPDRAHRQLGLERQAELAGHDDIERSLQGPRDLERHRNPTPGQPENDNVLATQVPETLSKLTPRIDPVTETAHRPPLTPRSPSRSAAPRRPNRVNRPTTD